MASHHVKMTIAIKYRSIMLMGFSTVGETLTQTKTKKHSSKSNKLQLNRSLWMIASVMDWKQMYFQFYQLRT